MSFDVQSGNTGSCLAPFDGSDFPPLEAWGSGKLTVNNGGDRIQLLHG